MAIAVVALWGFNFVVVEIALEEIPPLIFGCFRFFLTSIPAIFFVKKPDVPLRMVMWYGLTMFALQFSFLFLGMYSGVTPGLASLVLQFQLLFTLLLGAIFFKEKLGVRQVIGGSIAFLGIVIVGIHLEGDLNILGFFLVIAAAASWGIGNVLSKKMGKVHMFSLVIWGSFVAWPPLFILSFFMEGGDKMLLALSHISWKGGMAIINTAYLSTLLGFAAWSWLLARHPLKKIAPFTLLVPVFSMIGSVIVLQEPLLQWKIGAALLVIVGLCFQELGERPD